MHLPHAGGEVIIPAGEFVHRDHGVALVAGRKGLDEGAFDRSGAVASLHRRQGGDGACVDCVPGFRLAHPAPGQVNEGSGGVGFPPERNCTVRVGALRLAKAEHRLLVVEAIEPQQTTVEPELCLGIARGNRTSVPAEIEFVFHCICSHAAARRDPGIRTAHHCS